MDSKTRDKLTEIANKAEDKSSDIVIWTHFVEGLEKLSSRITDLFNKVIGIDSRLERVEEVKDGEDGYTPIKGKDYFDGKDGKDGEDGYTPMKGVDYFDGEDGKDGYDGVDGRDGKDGKDGEVREIELSGERYIEKIESSRRKLDVSAIKNLPETLRETIRTQRIGSQGFRMFKELEDTPGNFKGAKNKLVKVRKDERGLEFTESPQGVTDHSELEHLAYDKSGHTGFAPAGDYLTEETDPVFIAWRAENPELDLEYDNGYISKVTRTIGEDVEEKEYDYVIADGMIEKITKIVEGVSSEKTLTWADGKVINISEWVQI
jgi:hypothetical protein